MKIKEILASSLILVAIVTSILFMLRNPQDNNVYETALIKKEDLIKTVLASGSLIPSQFVKVGAQVDGQIKKIYVTEGQKVIKGQLLMEIDPTLQLSEVRKSQALLENSRSNIDLSAINVNRARLELKRQKGLEVDNAGIKKDLDDAIFALKESEIGMKTNKMQLVQAEMDLESANAKLGYTRIIAPIDGEVLGIIASEGQTIVSSQNSPTLIVLANLDVMKVNISINEVDVRKVIVGQKVYFKSTSDAQNTYTSKIKFVQKATSDFLSSDNKQSLDGLNKTSAYYSAGFEINNKNHSLLPSMTIDAHIIIEQKNDVLVVPNAALVQSSTPNKYRIKVLQGHEVEDREISIGLSNGIMSEVINGLREDEVIVLSAHKGSRE